MPRLEPTRKVFLSTSKIGKAGRGVFAAQPLKKGEQIEVCPVVVAPASDYMRLKKTLLKNYYFLWPPSYSAPHKKTAIALGFGSLYNHSYAPNATYTKMPKRQVIVFTALRAIKKGEEITVNYNYGDPDDKSPLTFMGIKPWARSRRGLKA